MKVLESFEDYEIRLPAGRFNGEMLPEVTLPKKKYSQQEIEQAKPAVLSVIHITRREQENALLRATLRKNEIPIPGEEAGAPITTAVEDGPKEETLGQKIPQLINPLAMNVGA